ncbi:MAG: tRNA preQ1(34) S-adenosylmethionine ribosyltransferase-isomerase QueA [Actinobacteria bacterium]|nr:tRNA preQ1(34) S-adenosylmethionine ribosyltransferase-isomerase QueA [Actinomycetota bacterium]MBW3649529.1 tRNA preQ1(34) S-adenosylmethionine ribosyltransferase-isomerase QueA [Actinomycetota bacterium]
MPVSASDEYHYHLPGPVVAQRPAEPRSAARLLVALGRDEGGGPEPVDHRRVADLADYVERGDVVVVNDTRVLPARLLLNKETGGSAEVLLLEPVVDGPAVEEPPAAPEAGEWQALVRPSRRIAPGTTLFGRQGEPVVLVGDRLGDDRRRVRLLAPLDAHGTLPLPPYIREPLVEPARYQTVYARRPGSVAAPTAGLHLTREILAQLRQKGAEVHTVDLAVGLGTFRPITAAHLDDHVMHEESYRVPASTMAACERARRVLAVGTTTLRALEAAALTGHLHGRTDLFVRPGFEFRVVDLLFTNFHLPRSSLLVLLAAFAGQQRWRPLYETALAEGYRFLSFGDAMLVSRAADRAGP